MSNSKYTRPFTGAYFALLPGTLGITEIVKCGPVVSDSSVGNKQDVHFICIQFGKLPVEKIERLIEQSSLWSGGSLHFNANIGNEYTDAAALQKAMLYTKQSSSDTNQEIRYCGYYLGEEGTMHPGKGGCIHGQKCYYIHCMIMRSMDSYMCIIPTRHALKTVAAGYGNATSRQILTNAAIVTLCKYYNHCNKIVETPVAVKQLKTVKVKNAPLLEEAASVPADGVSSSKKSWGDLNEEPDKVEVEKKIAQNVWKKQTALKKEAPVKKEKEAPVKKEKEAPVKKEKEAPMKKEKEAPMKKMTLQSRVDVLEEQVAQLQKQLVAMQATLDAANKNAVAKVLSELVSTLAIANK